MAHTPGRPPLRGRALGQRNRRVEAYRQLVRPVAIHYARCSPESQDDLMQVGLMGLIRAAELYSGKRCTPFEAFARPHIRGAILHYLRDVAPSVRLPRRQAERQSQVQRFLRQGQDDGQRPAGIDPAQWHIWQQQRQLNHPLPLSELREEELAAAAPAGCREQDSASGWPVETLLASLEARQRLVVRQVVLAGWSYRRLAEQMEVSPMTVQRLLRRGLQQLREQLDGAGLSPGSPPDRAVSAVPGW